MYTITEESNLYPPWLTLLAYATASSVSTPLFFSGGAVDKGIWFSSRSSSFQLDMYVSKRVTRFASIFDVLLRAIIGFITALIASRFSASVSWFYALSVGGVVSMLPGYTTLVSILEIAADKVASGTLRLATTFLVYSFNDWIWFSYWC